MDWTLDPPLPEELQIEVTGACNLRCRMCLVRYRAPIDRVSGSMGLESFVALLDDLPMVNRLTLQGLGEPLLAPDFLEMIDAARTRGIEVGFNTNGTLLTLEKCERLVAAAVDWLHVSIDGATPQTFAHVRAGARLERVVTNLETLVAAKRAARADVPRVQVNVVAMNCNVAEIPEIVRLAGHLGVDRCWVQGLAHDFVDTISEPAERAEYLTIREFTASEMLA